MQTKHLVNAARKLLFCLVLFQFWSGFAVAGLTGNGAPGPGEGIQEKAPEILSTTTWKWQRTVYDDGTKIMVPKPDSYALRFLPDGKVALRADCNMAGGVYKLNDREISIDITHSTMAACPPESLDGRYIRDLTASHDYVLEGTALRINLKFGMGAMEFQRQVQSD